MPLFEIELPPFLVQGERARLIPTYADTSREQRATSALLATLMAVEEFGKGLLAAVGAPAGKIAKIQCFTEVVFKDPQSEVKTRPDGLIVVRSGQRQWSAIVEAKIGGSELDAAQVEAYVDLARANDVDAIITISNQYALLPTHHPIQIDKRKAKSISMFHWSWNFVLSEAILHIKSNGLADDDQAFILEEFVRYLQHESSGVISFSQMASGWREVCGLIQQSMPIARTAVEAMDAVSSWHQLTRFLAIQMSIAVGHTVGLSLTRSQRNDPQQWVTDDTLSLVEANRLEQEFVVPNAAGPLKIVADLRRRTLAASMLVDAPKDRNRASSAITWLYRQIEKCPGEDLVVRAVYSGRALDKSATLAQLRADRNILLHPESSHKLNAFELVVVRDLGAKFRGPRTFVEEAEKILPAFYSDVGQRIRGWVPKPPEARTKEPGQILEGVDDAHALPMQPSNPLHPTATEMAVSNAAAVAQSGSIGLGTEAVVPAGGKPSTE